MLLASLPSGAHRSRQPAKHQAMFLQLVSQQPALWHCFCLCKQVACQLRPANFVPMSSSNSRANFAQAILVPTKSQQFPCQFGRSNSRANVCAAQCRHKRAAKMLVSVLPDCQHLSPPGGGDSATRRDDTAIGNDFLWCRPPPAVPPV